MVFNEKTVLSVRQGLCRAKQEASHFKITHELTFENLGPDFSGELAVTGVGRCDQAIAS